MTVMYRCSKESRVHRLTHGQVYKEWANTPCAKNAAVENDNGKIVFVDRQQYFRKMWVKD